MTLHRLRNHGASLVSGCKADRGFVTSDRASKPDITTPSEGVVLSVKLHHTPMPVVRPLCVVLAAGKPLCTKKHHVHRVNYTLSHVRFSLKLLLSTFAVKTQHDFYILYQRCRAQLRPVGVKWRRTAA